MFPDTIATRGPPTTATHPLLSSPWVLLCEKRPPSKVLSKKRRQHWDLWRGVVCLMWRWARLVIVQHLVVHRVSVVQGCSTYIMSMNLYVYTVLVLRKLVLCIHAFTRCMSCSMHGSTNRCCDSVCIWVSFYYVYLYFTFAHGCHIARSCTEAIDDNLGFMLDLVSSATVSFLDGYMGSPYAWNMPREPSKAACNPCILKEFIHIPKDIMLSPRRWFCNHVCDCLCKSAVHAVLVLNKNTAAIAPSQSALLNKIGVGHGIYHIGTGAGCCFVRRKEMQSETRSRACFCQTPVYGAVVLCVFRWISLDFHGYRHQKLIQNEWLGVDKR